MNRNTVNCDFITAQKTYRRGLCEFKETAVCYWLIEKLKEYSSIAEGFESEKLSVTWGSSADKESYSKGSYGTEEDLQVSSNFSALDNIDILRCNGFVETIIVSR